MRSFVCLVLALAVLVAAAQASNCTTVADFNAALQACPTKAPTSPTSAPPTGAPTPPTAATTLAPTSTAQLCTFIQEYVTAIYITQYNYACTNAICPGLCSSLCSSTTAATSGPKYELSLVNMAIQNTLTDFGLTNQTCSVPSLTCSQLCAASGVSASLVVLAASTVLAVASMW